MATTHPAGALYRSGMFAFRGGNGRLAGVIAVYIETDGCHMNYTYLLECADKTLYCGWTNDLEKRVKAHNSGMGAKYTKPRRPGTLVYYEEFQTKEEAMRREVAIKKLTRKEKEQLIAKQLGGKVQ